MTPFNAKLIEIGKKMSSSFEDHSVEFMDALVDGNGMRGLLEWVYFVLVGEKIITRIEELPTERKRNLWEGAKEFAKERIEKEKIIQLSRCLYAIEYYLN